MATIFDYLTWRGDIPFSEAAPLNPADQIILTRISYLPLRRFHWNKEHTLAELCEKMAHYDESKFRMHADIELVRFLKDAPRYQNLLITDYQQELHVSAEKQFCAVTIHLSEEELYLSYCGTDGTWAGWKEDWNLSYMDLVPSQGEALRYAKTMLEKYPEKKAYLGGHSKGGNLASFAAIFLSEPLQDRVLGVCSLDGPGFGDWVIENQGCKAMKDRMEIFVPGDSFFGQILTQPVPAKVVSSTAFGLSQHDPFTWEVLGPNLVACESGLSLFSTIANVSNHLWMDNTSPEDRAVTIDVVFDFLMVGDKMTTKETQQDWLKLTPAFLSKLAGMTPSQRDNVIEVLGELAKAYGTGAWDITVDTAKDYAYTTAAEVYQQFPTSLKWVADYILDKTDTVLPGINDKK